MRNWLLANPLSSDMDVLRPSLLPGLIHSLRHNVSRKNYDVALFEIGRVFTRAERRDQRRNAAWPSPLPASVCPALLERRGTRREVRHAFDLKGIVEEFLEQFGVRGVTFGGAPKARRCFWSPRRRIGRQIAAGRTRPVSPRWRKNMICATPFFWRS
jgi:phenylalanyl-tRNA synthetase beta subunit